MLKNEYLGLAGVTGFDPDFIFKYNALLEKLGAEGMLMQVECWMDGAQLSCIIDHIENNLIENMVNLPYLLKKEC